MGTLAETDPRVMTYPIGLLMHGRLAVVVGGGKAAQRPVAELAAAQAVVLVIAEELSQPLADLAGAGLISVRRRGYLAADLDGAWLALACSEQASVNAAVAADALRQRIWCVSAADEVATAELGPRQPVTVSAMPTTTACLLAPRQGHRVLVLGGARSGKSATAEAMLAGAGPVDYIATGHRAGDGDAEWSERVRAHQERRPSHWRTIETIDLTSALAGAPGLPAQQAPVLIDCLATWLAQVMDDCGLWAGGQDASQRLELRLDALLREWRQTHRQVVAVSNEVGCGIVPATASGRRFRDELGRLNARIAAGCEEVWLCTAGIAQRLR